ncbi:MAG: alpha/beta hydrolase [Candidatus Paceibacterota bacterium]
MNNLRARTIMVEDQPVRFYEHIGENTFLPPLVFLHGWRSSSRVWELTLRAFKEGGFTFYLIDLPGFGESDLPKEVFSIDKYAAVVEACIKRLGLLDPVLIGHSFGGRIGIKIAAKEKKILSKLVLVDAAGIRVEKGLTWKKILAKTVKPIFLLFPLEGLRRRIYQQLGAEDYLATPKLKETFVRIIEEDLRELLPKISCPTLIIWGDRDTETPLSVAHTMERRIPNSTLVIFEGAGHTSFLDEPGRFGQEIVAFIKKTSNEKES